MVLRKKYSVYTITLMGKDRIELSYRESGKFDVRGFLGGSCGWEKKYKSAYYAVKRADKAKKQYKCKWVRVYKSDAFEDAFGVAYKNNYELVYEI